MQIGILIFNVRILHWVLHLKEYFALISFKFCLYPQYSSSFQPIPLALQPQVSTCDIILPVFFLDALVRASRWHGLFKFSISSKHTHKTRL